MWDAGPWSVLNTRSARTPNPNPTHNPLEGHGKAGRSAEEPGTVNKGTVRRRSTNALWPPTTRLLVTPGGAAKTGGAARNMLGVVARASSRGGGGGWGEARTRNLDARPETCSVAVDARSARDSMSCCACTYRHPSPRRDPSIAALGPCMKPSNDCFTGWMYGQSRETVGGFGPGLHIPSTGEPLKLNTSALQNR